MLNMDIMVWSSKRRWPIAGMMQAWWLMVLLLSLSVQAAGLDFKMITLQHRFPQDVLPAVQQLAGPDGSVSAIDQHLVVRAAPEKMAAIEALVEKLDTARRNLRITVRYDNQQMDSRDAIGADGMIRHGDIEIGVGRYAEEQGSVRFNIDSSRSIMQQGSEQFLTVLDGERAFIRVGQSVPFTQQWMVLTAQYLNMQETTEFHDITTGFAVRPRYIGNQVEVEITPRIARLNAAGFIDFDELTTTVRVARGEWLDIGGLMQNRDQVSREIFLQSQREEGNNTRLRIKVDE